MQGCVTPSQGRVTAATGAFQGISCLSTSVICVLQEGTDGEAVHTGSTCLLERQGSAHPNNVPQTVKGTASATPGVPLPPTWVHSDEH